MDNANPQKILGHCPLCQEAYGTAGIKLVGERGQARLFHCTCTGCGQAVLAVVVETQGSVSSVGLVTDLEIQDALRFAALSPVTSDECLAAHRMLEDDSRGLATRLLDRKR
ncbi:hypothetical protein HZC53_04060 [Candidatus Uhrbacteria bacterium]|nr:hypothetical protein [Candidatus Uhrbacteria bacterium]